MIFSGKYGNLEIVPVNVDLIFDLCQARLPEKPKPPVRTMEVERFTIKEALASQKLAESRGITIEEAEEIYCAENSYEDTEDPDYISRMNLWFFYEFQLLSGEVISESVLLDVGGEVANYDQHKAAGREVKAIKSPSFLVAHQTLNDNEERLELYKAIVSISKVTWAGILKAAKEIGATRGGRPILEVSGGNSRQESQTITTVALTAASHYSITPKAFLKMPIEEQEYTIAQHLIERWMEHWAYEDRKNQVD